MTRCCISIVFFVLFPALLFLTGCDGGPHYDPVPHPHSFTGYAYPESDGDLRLEFGKPSNWWCVAGFEIYRDVLYEARSRPANNLARDIGGNRALLPVAAIDRNDAVIQGDNVILWDSTASSGYLYVYRIIVVYADGSRSDIQVLNGLALEMNLTAFGPYVPPPVNHVTAPPALITDGHATLYWYMPGESIVEPPVATYAMPGYVTSFEVEMEVDGTWTTVTSGIGRNIRSVQVPAPELNTMYRYTVRAVSSELGMKYPLEALSPAQLNQVIVYIGSFCY